MKRAILITSLLVASQPLLIGAGVLTRWAIECGGDTCAGTVRANSPFGPPRDLLLTALAVSAPFLLAVLVAAVTWLLVGRTAAQPAAEPFPAASDPQGMARELVGEVRGRPLRRWTTASTPHGEHGT